MELKENLSMEKNPSNPKISIKEKIGYGFGDLASNFVWTSMGMFVVYFYTDVIGMAAGIIGTIMLLSRFLDGITDVIMGAIIDKTTSKHGKARPWMLWLAIPFAISAVLLFTVPNVGEVGKIIYIIITYNFITLIYTGLNVPYGALNSLITQDQYQRSVLNVFRMSNALIGVLIVSNLTVPLVSAFGDGQSGWAYTFAVYGIVGAVLFALTFKSTKERVKPSKQTQQSKDIPFKVSVGVLLKNKYWIIVTLFFVVTYIFNGVKQGSTIYFAQYILGQPELVGLITMAGLIPAMAVFLVLAPILKRFGKRNTMIGGTFIAIAGSLIILINPTSLTLVLVGSVVKGIGGAPVIGTIFAMLADTIEYGEWKTGIRNEGMVYSGGSMGLKIGTGLGTALIGWVLAMGSYAGGQAVQADSAIFSINALFIYIPIILNVVQVILLYFYKLDKIYPQIVTDLQERAK